jgi:hypothetical protein
VLLAPTKGVGPTEGIKMSTITTSSDTSAVQEEHEPGPVPERTADTKAGSSRQSRPVWPTVMRVFALCVATVMVGLGTAGWTSPAEAASGPVSLPAGVRCWPASGGSALVQVSAPAIESTPAIQSPGTVGVGGEGQRIGYQPYLQRWDGTKWVTILVGPYFTGAADQSQTWWDSGTGAWNVTVSRAGRYRVAGQIWWIADATHYSAYANRLASHQQWRTSPYSAWWYVSNCVY